jgi:ABC-2 type transport system ATP-binding protein/lipopolysaccharide transport system ATP-binding protein
MSQGATVLFVSHSLGQVEKLCERVVWLESGKVRKIGQTKEIIEEYKKTTLIK